MSRDVELGCRCGEVCGVVRGVGPNTVNRAICYCRDCQAFLHHLGRGDLLDAHGGTDIVQAAPQTVTFERGQERIVGLRLTPKGLYRWHASCCKTPLGNTMTPVIPFIGMAPEIFRGAPNAASRDEIFGPVRGSTFRKHATGGLPEGSTKSEVRLIAHALRLMLGWKLRGKTWPHPFFDRPSGAPNFPLTTLSPAEREALRRKRADAPA